MKLSHWLLHLVGGPEIQIPVATRFPGIPAQYTTMDPQTSTKVSFVVLNDLGLSKNSSSLASGFQRILGKVPILTRFPNQLMILGVSLIS